uniref:ATP synthase complex subunit 8 n=1 Tax=Allobates gasconi TaxID=384861 RepID=A0A7L9CUV3_9NEOB|nr:ATP synthase F0 subunit 8 [Allobates gasconi]
MAQLTPGPWFFILFSSWMILLFFATAKVTKFAFLNTPTYLTAKNTNLPWSWPWQ